MSSNTPPLHQAILHTLAYADVFDYPLTASEIHRYLVGFPSTLACVQETLTNGLQTTRAITQTGAFFTLAGREGLTETRARRAAQAARLWPDAIRYGHHLARFPFVRMIALTGALAVQNVEEGADIDYFIVTEPGRLWVCRALVIGLVHWAARSGIIICPNFFLAANALKLPDQNLYTAREIAQMIPLAGFSVYQAIRDANPWVNQFLPNAEGPPRLSVMDTNKPSPRSAWQQGLETILRSPFGHALETWEMNRKIRKFTAQFPTTAETRFSPERCQGHFDGYGKKTMEAFAVRLEHISVPTTPFEVPLIPETEPHS